MLRITPGIIFLKVETFLFTNEMTFENIVFIQIKEVERELNLSFFDLYEIHDFLFTS